MDNFDIAKLVHLLRSASTSTRSSCAKQVSGQVRYALTGGRGGGFRGRGGSGAIMSWVQANGTPVTLNGARTNLYDLGTLAEPTTS